MTCGEEKTITGAAPLVCELAAGHTGTHATLNAGAVVARWPVPWTAEDEAAYTLRHRGAPETSHDKKERRR